ncbi:MAG: proline--tRNA ligase [Rhodospirillales bacterium]|nr:proline--tRNA ligase [Rhodospirillales bacterium]MCB9973879.1 proline--tRNA ligase [Rhodospirillales bacterium]
MAKQKTAITPTREENFPEWYQQVIKAADMAENAPVRGCMIIKPYGYALWENMQRIFDDMIKEEGVQNAYFPLLIPLSFMSREAEHVEGFAKECAVVTHHRLEQGPEGLIPAPSAKLEEPFIIRPTSETIIGDAMARWVQSYRDLPLKLNQWCNVMRWEMRTRMFLRTSEFLWQEGHNAFETAEEAREDALKMIHMYGDFAENDCALPVIRGEKTADERFPGADATFTMESIMQDGKALQAGTSHDLGQNFAKSIGIKFQGREGTEEFAHTTSWGISTRLIGGMIMTHGDDDGMMMPPRVAPQQVAIIPVVRDETAAQVNEACETLKTRLKAAGVRVHLDTSEARTPDKMWGAIKKGIPLRVEIGAQEVADGTLTHIRRDLGRESKTTCSVNEFIGSVHGVLEAIQSGMLERARSFRDANLHDGNSLSDVKDFFSKEDSKGLVKVPVSVLNDPALEAVYKEYSLSSRCMPFADDGQKVLIGKAY